MIRNRNHPTICAQVLDEAVNYWIAVAADPDSERFIGRGTVALPKWEWLRTPTASHGGPT